MGTHVRSSIYSIRDMLHEIKSKLFYTDFYLYLICLAIEKLNHNVKISIFCKLVVLENCRDPLVVVLEKSLNFTWQ